MRPWLHSSLGYSRIGEAPAWSRWAVDMGSRNWCELQVLECGVGLVRAGVGACEECQLGPGFADRGVCEQSCAPSAPCMHEHGGGVPQLCLAHCSRGRCLGHLGGVSIVARLVQYLLKCFAQELCVAYRPVKF